MSKTVNVVGMDQFMRYLAKQSTGVQNAVSQELGKSGKRVEKKAKDLAPVDTGDMRQRIYSKKVSPLRVATVSPVHYSIYVEEGTRRMRAQPFLGPALKAEKPLLMRNLSRIVRGGA